MTVCKVEKVTDVFGREYWKLYDYRDRWIRFRCDVWDLQDAKKAFETRFHALIERY